MSIESETRRRRNPRGQGDRLREDIVTAATKLMSDPSAPLPTLRGIARAVGVAATSVYLHFPDIESLGVEVARRGFESLLQAQDLAMDAATDPIQRLRAGGSAYCEWGLANPGLYHWMFSNPHAIQAETWEQLPGRPVFQALVARVAAYLGRDAADPEATRTAQLVWFTLHGAVSLRISRPYLPWPPVEEVVADAVTRVVESQLRSGDAPRPTE